MKHENKVIDTNNFYEIDGASREIIATDTTGLALKKAFMQYDHNSERITFKLPRYIDSHDMLECNSIAIHYLNAGSGGVGVKEGVYEVTDLRVNPEDENTLLFTWLVSQNVTEQPGELSFLVRFACVAEDGTYAYVWNTAIYSDVSVLKGIYNSPEIAEQYADILEQWKQELFKNDTFIKNVVKKTVIGKTLSIEDASPDTHDLDIKIESKNLFSFSSDASNTYGGLTYATSADSSVLKITGSFTGQITGNYNFLNSELNLKAGIYTISISGLSSGRLNVNRFDTEQQKYINLTNVTTTAKTFVLETDTTIRLQTIVPVGSVFDDEVLIQIEHGNTATSLVNHKLENNITITVSDGEQMQSKVADSEGVVKGLKSVAPRMDIATDNDDVFINCTYEVAITDALELAKNDVNGECLLNMLVLEQGYIANNGSLSPHNCKIRTKNFIHGFKSVSVPDKYKICGVYYYDEKTNVFVSSDIFSTELLSSCSFGKPGCKAKLVFARKDETKLIVPDELQAVTIIMDFDERISKLEKNSPVEFEYDHNLADVSSHISGMSMVTADMMSTVYTKFDELISANPGYVSKVDAVEFLNMEYPSYATEYRTYMYKLIDSDLPSTGVVSPKKKLLLFGGIHGDEPCSIANLYIFAKRLCSDVMTDANLFKLRANIDIYIVPCVNGYGIMNVTRQNANRININRNYPTSNWLKAGAVGDRDYGGETAGSEFETQLVLGLIAELNPMLTIDHHSYGLDGRQFYTGIRGDNTIPYIYRSYVDCSLAFKKGLPQYFGGEFGLVDAFISSNYSPTMGQLPDWLYEQGYNGGIVEASMCINYNNGEISNVMIDRLGNDTMSVAEYTLRNQVMRYVEYALTN